MNTLIRLHITQLEQGSTVLLDVSTAVPRAGLQLDQPLVHDLQKRWIDLLHDVLQLMGIRCQVVHLYERLQEITGEIQLKVWSTTAHLTDMCSPRCLRTRSTAGLHPSEFWRRRMCCWRRLRIRSLGSIPRRKKTSLGITRNQERLMGKGIMHRRSIYASTRNLS